MLNIKIYSQQANSCVWHIQEVKNLVELLDENIQLKNEILQKLENIESEARKIFGL